MPVYDLDQAPGTVVTRDGRDRPSKPKRKSRKTEAEEADVPEEPQGEVYQEDVYAAPFLDDNTNEPRPAKSGPVTLILTPDTIRTD